MKKSINVKSTKEKINNKKEKNKTKENILNKIEKKKSNSLFKILLQYSWYINIPMVILSFVLVYNNIYPINVFWTIIYYIIYYIVFFISICSIGMLKNERFKNILIIVGILVHILNINNFALFIPCALYMFLFSKRLRVLKMLAMFIPITISIIIFSVYLSVLNYTEKTEIKKVISPNENYIARHIKYNAGALGGNEIVMLELRYRFIMIKKEKKLYTDAYGKNISIRFKDNKHLILNGREIDVKI